MNGFDEIADTLNIEKIKTIGDAYFAVSGLHFNNNDHPQKMMLFAIKARSLLGKINKEFAPESLLSGETKTNGQNVVSSSNGSPDDDEKDQQKESLKSFFVFCFFLSNYYYHHYY